MDPKQRRHLIGSQEILNMQRISAEEYKKKYGESSLESFGTQPKPPTLLQNIKEVGIGIAKGAGNTAQGLANIGRIVTDPVVALTDPNKTLSEVKSESPYFSEETLSADNTAQKVGKGIELVAEILFPVSKASKGIGAAEKLGASFDKISSRLNSLGDDVLPSGVKIKDKIIDLVTNLDDKTKNALSKTTRDEFNTVLESGRKAMQADENITPYEIVGNKIIDGLKQFKSKTGGVGARKSEIMETAKVGYTKVGNIAQRSALDIQKAFSGVKLDPSDAKIIKDFQSTLMKLGENPRLKDVDAAIDLLQDRLYKTGRSNVLEVTDRVTGRLRNAVEKLNEQVKNLGGEEYAKANDAYSKGIRIVNELNARLGKEGGQAGSLIKRLFSPSDARTKELFKQLSEITGVDYFKEARLAKFVMEALDDTRAYSMLEQIPKTPTGAIEKVIDYGIKKLQDPIKAARRVLKD